MLVAVREALQKLSEEPLRECPACGAPELKKQITAAGFRLKGSGWYETDFKKKPEKPKADSKKTGGEVKPADTGKTPPKKSKSS